MSSAPDSSPTLHACISALADHSDLHLYVCDAAGVLTYLSPAAIRQTGIEVGHSILASLAPNASPHALRTFQRLATEDSVITDLPMVLVDGTVQTFRFFTQALRTTDGALDGFVGVAVSAAKDVELEAEIHHRANHDPLTDLLSRGAVSEQLESRLRHQHSGVAVLYMDLDGFKEINDVYGHAVGDHVLQVVAKRLRGTTRDSDLVGRLGGDEFLVVTTVESHEQALAVGHRIRSRLAQRIRSSNVDVQPDVSVGIAVQTDRSTAAELIHDADIAMYDAKQSHQRVVLADSAMRSRINDARTIDRDLPIAMKNGDLKFHYQPVRNIETGELLGCEALVRWTHADLGAILPGTIISHAESSGQIDEFTMWMLETVARDWSELRGRWPAIRLTACALNLSSRQLSMVGYVDRHLEVIARNGLSPQDVMIEVTHSGEIAIGLEAETTLQQLGERGVALALDDFGVGYNALSYFTRIPVAAIKVDRSIIVALPTDPTARVIAENLVRMADQLGILAVAVGIETDDEMRECRDVGFAQGQGHLLGRPVALEALEATERQAKDADGTPANN